MRDYTNYIRVMLKKGDRERIRERMKEAGIKNMSAYIRKVAMDGHIVKLDLSDVNEVARLLRINANNLNQYAKQANTNGSIYYANIKTLQKQQDELWQLLKAILDRLLKL
ncbi:MAG: plasmid mobilization relaxosome protein MobC [Lachnospiraceae bacterium]|nr:plasmid mobilization relaxosome protein MobC [Lachnospiraceae bacterium]